MKIKAKVVWGRDPEEAFLDGRYKRVHQWLFDGGQVLAASASPDIVPLPYSDPALVDPEEAFVVSLSSCHMLFFLSIAAKKKYLVECYQDEPEAFLEKNEEGRMALLSLTLQPEIIFGGSRHPSPEAIEEIHQLAHENCFLANSVRTTIKIQPTKAR